VSLIGIKYKDNKNILYIIDSAQKSDQNI